MPQKYKRKVGSRINKNYGEKCLETAGSCGNFQKMMKNVISKKKRDFLKMIFFFRNFYKKNN
jgi:hypothetical protein